MAERKLNSVWDLRDYCVSRDRLFSATHAEIINGWTTDIYFAKSLDVLRHLELDRQPTAAEIFANRSGVLCGVEEIVHLLSGKGLEVWGLREGERFSEREVVLQIRGPYAEYGLYETALLGVLASSSGWATAAALCKEAAGPKPVISFGARHVHPAVAPVMERAAVIGGADGASCILGAKLAGREPIGTLPHACFLVAGDTVKVAEAYPEAMPPGTPVIILVDTFKDEVEETLRVARALEGRLSGVRLDTPSERGRVTPGLVREVRAHLQMAGFEDVRIIVSGGLDPARIAELAEAGADVFGVGSFIAAAGPIDMTMDIKEVDGRPVAKRGRIPGLTPSPRLKRLL